jgi:thiamine-phosphate pyrophosphorylase
MTRALEALRASFDGGDLRPLQPHLTADVILDWSLSEAPDRGIYEGGERLGRFFASRSEAFTSRELRWADPLAIGDRLAVAGHTIQRGHSSGAEVRANAGIGLEFDGEKISTLKLFPKLAEARRWIRVRLLREARLYLVTDAVPGVDGIIDAALRGGADVVQLREKSPRCAEELVSLADPFRRAARRHGALFVLNDRPDLVRECGADGVHVGQDDATVAEARVQAGDDALVGLSTHQPAQLDAAESMRGEGRPDYLSVGPVWETPTKEGRSAAGLDYVRYAAANASLPWFAIGGIDSSNITAVTGAGAGRVVVVRAIRDADEPGVVARELRAALPDGRMDG